MSQKALPISITPNPLFVAGTTETFLGAVYLLSGTVTTIRSEQGATLTTDQATLKLYRQSDNTLVSTLNNTGTLAVVTASNVSIGSSGLYEMRGASNSSTGIANFRGVEFDLT